MLAFDRVGSGEPLVLLHGTNSSRGVWAPLLGRLGVELPLRSALGRRMALSSVSAQPAAVPPRVALAAVRTARASKHFPEHFRRTRVLRFRGGCDVPGDVPVRVVWGDKDRVALARKSRFEGELPAQALVETWADWGHMLMWDRPGAVVAAALGLPRSPTPPI